MSEPPSRARRLILVALIVSAAVGLDQATKQWAVATLRGGPPEVLLSDLLELEYSFNPGSAFGMLADTPAARPVFIASCFAALLYMAWLLRRMPTAFGYGFVGLALMAGGAIGNLIDRLARVDLVRLRFHDHLPFWALIEHPREVGEAMLRNHYWADLPRHGVVDFIVIHLGADERWPAFNVADTCLVMGVSVFVLYLARHAGAILGPAAPPPP